METKFGTSGLRGPAAELLAGAARAHVSAFCDFLLQAGHARRGDRMFIARDRRDSSPELAAQAAGAIAASGFVTADCGEVPTPALAALAFSHANGAVMVTGSHIPADRNGLKFYLPDGEIAKTEEAAIAGLAQGLRQPARSAAIAGEWRDEALSCWTARARPLASPGALAGMRIGVHHHSSVATQTIAQVLASMGAELVEFDRAEAFVPVDTEAVSAGYIELYRSQALLKRLDAIVSTDADGDRPLVADERGDPVAGDLLGWLTALRLGADSVATPATSNSSIADAPGITVHRTRVGSPFVLEAMKEAASAGAKRVAGFEANGGFLTASAFAIGGSEIPALATRDSLLPILATLRHARQHGLALSRLAAGAGFRAKAAGRLQDYEQARARALMERLGEGGSFRERFFAGLPAPVSLDTTDGLRFALEGGAVLHLRPSGNAPEMRCYAEAAGETGARRLLDEGLKRLAAFEG